jgi:hypothetical protein
MKIKIKASVEKEAKTLKLHLKPVDSFYASLVSADGEELKDYEGYVPDFMPGKHYGDYLYLDIDLETGQITNWVKPTAEQLEKFVNGGDDE